MHGSEFRPLAGADYGRGWIILDPTTPNALKMPISAIRLQGGKILFKCRLTMTKPLKAFTATSWKVLDQDGNGVCALPIQDWDGRVPNMAPMDTLELEVKLTINDWYGPSDPAIIPDSVNEDVFWLKDLPA